MPMDSKEIVNCSGRVSDTHCLHRIFISPIAHYEASNRIILFSLFNAFEELLINIKSYVKSINYLQICESMSASNVYRSTHKLYINIMT